MNDVILITGKVHFQINLDPSIWTFDERKFPMEDKFPHIDGLGIALAPFFDHAKPKADASQVICHRRDKPPIAKPFSLIYSSYACFAIDNQPIKQNGPIKLYYQDGSNQKEPIDSITRFEVV